MEEINADFKGIELAVIYPQSHNAAFFQKVRQSFINALLGDRQGLTIIGPASIVKEIKKDPNRIQLFTSDVKLKRPKGKKRKKKD